MSLIKDIIKLSNQLELEGNTKASNQLDKVINRYAQMEEERWEETKKMVGALPPGTVIGDLYDVRLMIDMVNGRINFIDDKTVYDMLKSMCEKAFGQAALMACEGLFNGERPTPTQPAERKIRQQPKEQHKRTHDQQNNQS